MCVQTLKIHYVSYGPFKTGGYRHEIALFKSAVTRFRSKGPVNARISRLPRLFENTFAHLQLLIWSFFKSNGDIVIVPARLALSAMSRNAYNHSQVWIVLHNYDHGDGKSAKLKLYYERLFNKLRQKKDPRFKIISVSPFWENYFKNTLQLPNVSLFPNLFDTSYYGQFRRFNKNAWVHLGQWSSKNDRDIFRLAAALSTDGYYCYFSTLNPHEAKPHDGRFEIICFHNFRDYLDHMSLCCCTLALTRINEGWNRVAHESLLVGTPVIGYNRGGLGDLLKKASCIIVNDVDEAYTVIKENLWMQPEKDFYTQFDIHSGPELIDQL